MLRSIWNDRVAMVGHMGWGIAGGPGKTRRVAVGSMGLGVIADVTRQWQVAPDRVCWFDAQGPPGGQYRLYDAQSKHGMSAVPLFAYKEDNDHRRACSSQLLDTTGMVFSSR